MIRCPRTRGEQGIAAPFVIGLMVAMLAFSLVGVKVAVSASHSAQRSKDTTAALAAADSGIQVALFRLNQVRPGLGECVVIDPVTREISKQNATQPLWCDLQPGEDLGESRSYRYRTSDGQLIQNGCQRLQRRTIIAQGRSNAVVRTIRVNVATVGGSSLFSTCGVMAEEWVKTLARSEITGDVATDGFAKIKNHSKIYGSLTYFIPPPQTVIESDNANDPAYVSETATQAAEQTLDLQPLDLPKLSETNNGNGALPGASSPLHDPSCPASALSNNYQWDPQNRELLLKGTGKCAAQLLMTGQNYRFCRLRIQQQAKLIIPTTRDSDEPAKLWIEPTSGPLPDPAETPCSHTGDVRMQISGKASIVSPGPTDLMVIGQGYKRKPDGVTPSSRLHRLVLSNKLATAQHMIVWAPNYEVKLLGNMKLVGAAAAQRVRLRNHASIQWSPEVATLSLTAARLAFNYSFSRGSWIACGTTDLSSADPAANC